MKFPKTFFFLILGYLLLNGIEFLVGYFWFGSYQVKSYETAIDHFVILKIFLLVKTVYICASLGYLLLLNSARRYWTFEVFICILIAPLVYLAGFVKYRCDHVYGYLKSPFITYEGRFFEYDPMLGKRAIKNASGYQDYWIKTGNDFRKRLVIDSLGFRIPEHKYTITDSALMLYLGCSYTWGDGCIAEETYPYLVSKAMGDRYINAGQSAYGLAQMDILAERLIPLYRPKYVFVQYSPWLIQRSLAPFKQTVFFADIAFPYIAMDKGSITLEAPPFESGLLSFDSEHYRLSPASYFDKLRFFYDYGIRVVLHDLVHKYAYLLRNDLNKNIQWVDADRAQSFLYNKIFDVAHKYNCQVYVVKIDNIYGDSASTKGFFAGEQVIDTDSTLHAIAHNDRRTYERLFYHWALQGKDSVIADVHPNPYAHSIIADQILKDIETKK